MSELPPVRYYPRPALVEQIRAILSSGLVTAVTMFAARRMGKTEFVQREPDPGCPGLAVGHLLR